MNELVHGINNDIVNAHSERRFRMSCTAKVSFRTGTGGADPLGSFGPSVKIRAWLAINCLQPVNFEPEVTLTLCLGDNKVNEMRHITLYCTGTDTIVIRQRLPSLSSGIPCFYVGSIMYRY